MFKRAVRQAVQRGTITVNAVAELTDDAFMQRLIERDRSRLALAIRERRLFKRALDLPASEVPEAQGWLTDDPDLLEQVEDWLARRAGLEPGELLVDFPVRANMLAVDIPLRLRDGRIERLTSEGRAGQLGLPRIADELYQSAQRLRVFVSRTTARLPEGDILELASQPAATVKHQLGEAP